MTQKVTAHKRRALVEKEGAVPTPLHVYTEIRQLGKWAVWEFTDKNGRKLSSPHGESWRPQ